VWHEAAHAVAVYLHGGRLVYVSALPSPERWGGVCTWRHGDEELRPIAEASSRPRDPRPKCYLAGVHR
jgi:hypothetical protein